MFYFVCLCECVGMFACLNSGFSQPMWTQHVVVCGLLRGVVWHEICVRERDQKSTKPVCDKLS